MPWSLFPREESRNKTDPSNQETGRYFQDLQDALWMRRSSSHHQHDATTPPSDTTARQEQEATVVRQLNRAEELKRTGQLAQALAMYETALGEGLQLCRRHKDTSLLNARLLRAMSDAEEIKASLIGRTRRAIDGNLSELQLSILDDFHVDPSSLQSTSWDDIAGLEQVKQSLQENVILPLLRPDLFFQGLRRPQNLLLYGPPGTGKTMLVRACAQESKSCHLFVCSASNLVSKWMGESEKLVKGLLDVARSMAPSIIFIDEVDSILSRRKSEEHEASRRLKTEFMVQLDGIHNQQRSQVIVIAATNCPWDLDEAIIRRFPKLIYVPLPDAKTRRILLKQLLVKAGKHSLLQTDIDWLVEQTKGWSCSDITALASEASYGPLRSLGSVDAIRKANPKDVRPLARLDFENALTQLRKSVSTKLLKQFAEWKQDHGST